MKHLKGLLNSSSSIYITSRDGLSAFCVSNSLASLRSQVRHVSDFFKQRPPLCAQADEQAEEEQLESKPNPQPLDSQHGNHYSHAGLAWAADERRRQPLRYPKNCFLKAQITHTENFDTAILWLWQVWFPQNLLEQKLDVFVGGCVFCRKMCPIDLCVCVDLCTSVE